MKTLRVLAAALFAASFLTLAAYASDVTGTWKWTSQGRNGPRETSAKLVVKDGALSGSIAGRNGDTAIEDASLKDGVIAFSVSRQRNNNKSVTKYTGKVEGDKITGTFERPGRNGGEPQKTEWIATKAK